jgi:hypothetical protein
MELYIRIKDGQPFEHPIIGSNFREAFPSIDVNNLPPEFIKFEKQDLNIGVYEVFDSMPYFIESGVCKDGRVRQMTPEEKQAKIDSLHSWWKIFGFSSWVFNEEKAEFVPPVPRPDMSRKYTWNEDIKNWVEAL